MKKIIMILLVLALSACVTTTPTKAPAPPTDVPPTATVEPTTAATATEEPAATETPLPEATPTEAAAATGQNSFGEITFENRKVAGSTVSGSGEFSVSAFAYKCETLPDQVTLTVTVDNPDIYKVNYLYRLTAIDTPLIDSGWSGDAKMKALGDGKFTVDFSSSQISSKYRGWKAWFDVQFIAFDNQDITYTSPIFSKLITYTLNCP